MPPRHRNGYGKPRRLTLTNGTLPSGPGPRPQRAVCSRVLPLFKRQTKEVGELLPQLDLHGLALGDFELALRGLLGEGAPLSPAALLRLKTQWQVEYEAWKHDDSMTWKLLQVAESTFRRCKGAELLPAVYAGAQYVDGVQQTARTRERIAA